MVKHRQIKSLKPHHLLSLVNIRQLGRFALLTDDRNPVAVLLSDLLSLGLPLICRAQGYSAMGLTYQGLGASPCMISY